MNEPTNTDPAVASAASCSACRDCGTAVKAEHVLCMDCCRKAAPEGPPLKRIRKYGFEPTSMHHRDLKLSRSFGAIPIKSYPKMRMVLMARLYVACDGKTYIDYERCADGCSLSWSEPYPQNSVVKPRAAITC
jgi:hypothetical protein